jgi:pyroglutamyl-peptidase
VLPTTYAAASDLPALLAKHNPDLVLFFGLAAGNRFMRVEIEAVNSASLLHPDAAQARPGRRILIRNAPPRLSVRAPVRRLIAAARATGASVQLSRDAGRYICNAALFSCLDTAHRTGRPGIVAFVHIPRPRPRFPRRSRNQSSGPTLAALIRAGEAILLALLAQCRRG